jgi:hypothetical protein
METSIWMVINSHLNDALFEMQNDRGIVTDRIRFVQELVRQFSIQQISARVNNEELNRIWETVNE